jgi:PAS domain S-box-containing protein
MAADNEVPRLSAIDELPVGAAYFRSGRFLWVNRALCQMTGYSEEYLLKMDPVDMLVPEDQAPARERFLARQRGEVPPFIYEIHVRRPDGSVVTLEVDSRTVPPDGVLGVYRDVTPHRSAQRLLEGLAQLAARVQLARDPDAVCKTTLDGLFELGFLTGIALIRPGGYAFRWRAAPELEALAPVLFKDGLDFGRSEALDTCVRTLEPVYIEDIIAVLRPRLAGRGVAFGPEQVIKMRKLGVDKLTYCPMSSHGRAFGVLGVAGEGMSRETAAAIRLFAAQVAGAFAVAETIVELRQKNDRLAAINAVANAGNESAPGTLGEQLLRVVVEATGSDSGSLFRAGKECLELEATVNVPDWFAQHYRTLPFTTTVSGGAATARKARALMLEDWPPDHHDRLRRAGGLASALLPLEVKGKLGGLVVLARDRPEPYRDSDLAAAELLADQVAVQLERARLLQELRHSYDELAHTQKELVKRERLAALGELSAVIAHEVRNPLGVLFNSLASLRRMPLSDEARPLLGIVSEESERLDRLVSDLLDFARPNEPRLNHEAPVQLIASAVEAARRGTGLQGVQVRAEVSDALPAVWVDAELCRQALLNLLHNAAQATGRGGEVLIRALHEGQRQPPAVRIDVCDSGVGIAPDVADRIFQPFFTTRASGTGLGLALVKRIAEAHRAELSFQSAPGKGTTFSVWLPLAPAAKAP